MYTQHAAKTLNLRHTSDLLASRCNELVSMATPAKLRVCRREQPSRVAIAPDAD